MHKYIGAAIFIWVIAALAGSFTTGTNLVAATNISSPVQDIMYFSETITQSDTGIWSLPVAAWGFFRAILRVVFLDFPVFHEGPWVIVRWIIVAPFIGCVVYGIVATFVGVFQKTV